MNNQYDHVFVFVLQEITNASIPEVDKGRISVSQNVLHFKTLHESRDNGMYQCAASNLYGTRYSTAELRVLSK